MTPLVLCYHAVSAAWVHKLSVPPDQVLRDVRAIRRLRPVTVTFDDAFRSVSAVLPGLEEIDVAVTIFVCTEYADRGGAPLGVAELETDGAGDPAELATMSWDDLRAHAERGIQIGSHTVSHAHLTRLSNAELQREVAESKGRIEEELGRPCIEFAYPYGEQDPRVRAAVRAAGYVRAFRLRSSGRGDPFALPRLDVYRGHGLLRTLLKSAVV